MLIKKNLDLFVQGAQLNFETHRHVAPTLAINLDNEIKISPLDFKDNETKDTAAEIIKGWIAQGRVKEYLIIAESWLASSEEDGSIHGIQEWLRTHGSLENYPDRREAVMVVYSNPEEEIIYTAYIDRMDHQSAVLGEWSMSIRSLSVSLAAMSSRFDSLFIKGKIGQN